MENEFKNMKIRVNFKEESKKLQEYLFSLGYSWIIGKIISYLKRGFIYTYDDGLIVYGNNERNFINHPFKEYKLKENITFELEEVE